ncbi:MAG: hypothetical protein CO073_02440 [Candidatus Komeilibacteria bacterium CG_4_9_14_0_8_um_filter_36_9]|uniref:Uncharacterized protein n=1 Tax=Candidatus Komeilibacteria bacterium CG_4_9_14_0_8_um_filter_36_9 TaxID=1974473 RepID=A0A2M8DRB6_9BACT|nr:MAG: hypothetical protein CO073_02440 [Candidatus Komeilibacteria bacterium CG_4_9_14_0_8_um_filter_36_9]
MSQKVKAVNSIIEFINSGKDLNSDGGEQLITSASRTEIWDALQNEECGTVFIRFYEQISKSLC